MLAGLYINTLVEFIVMQYLIWSVASSLLSRPKGKSLFSEVNLTIMYGNFDAANWLLSREQ